VKVSKGNCGEITGAAVAEDAVPELFELNAAPLFETVVRSVPRDE
jgi:hypothetical protein